MPPRKRHSTLGFDLAEFGKRLVRLRKARAWSQSQLAEAAKLDAKVITEYEHGRRSPSNRTIARLINALDTTVHELVGGGSLSATARSGLVLPLGLPTQSDVSFLKAECGVVPFDRAARAEELEWLSAFCRRPEPCRLALLTADGGVGKTRLLLEFCKTSEHEYETGFIPSWVTRDQVEKFLTPGPLRLLVIDYAESRADLVGSLVERAALRNDVRLRIVLLARSAGAWWTKLRERQGFDHVPYEQRELRPLGTTVEQRQTMFRAALHAYNGTRPSLSVQVVRQPQLDARHFERTLYVHMAALLASRGESVDGEERGLLDAVVDHERRLWAKPIDALEVDELIRQSLKQAAFEVIALVTLRGGASRTVAINLARATGRLSARADLPEHLIELLHAAYGDKDGKDYLRPLEPDLLGERWVYRVLDQIDGERRTALLEQAACGDAFRSLLGAMYRIARTESSAIAWIRTLLPPERLRERALVAIQVESAWVPEGVTAPFNREIATLLREHGTPELAAEILAHLPSSTVSLADVAVWATGALVEAARAIESETVLASRLVQHATRLEAIGDHERAATVRNEAIERLRRLARKRRGLRVDLGVALAKQSKCLGVMGESVFALVAAAEALTILRKEQPRDPSRLALALQNFAYVLRGLQLTDAARKSLAECGIDVDPTTEAATSIAEAVELRRTLPAPSLEARRDLANTLADHAVILSDLRRHDDALACADEVTVIYRELAAHQPDSFASGLADALGNLAQLLTRAGRVAEGVAAANEAVAIHRRLAAMRPGAFEPDLALWLVNLGDTRVRVGEIEEALQPTREAIAIYRRLLPDKETRFAISLAYALNNEAAILAALKRECLDPVDEAISLLRTWGRPAELAAAIANRSELLLQSDQPELALEGARESMRVLGEDPQRHRIPVTWVAEISKIYKRACAANRVTPDEVLLGPVREAEGEAGNR